MKLFDTSVAIDHLRGRQPATAVLEDVLQSEDSLTASELTRFELLAGVRPHEHAEVEAFLSLVDWAPVTEEVTRQAAEFARSYRRSHSGIGAIDYLIAGTAATLCAELLTTNVKLFPMFSGLRAPYAY